ncbi:MAG: ATP-binding protein [Deltaproteobacteria bacterium]|nr:ATP-binding protein [Deltaproteobacteria bacterium]
MARADLIKRLFRCHKASDPSGFMDAAQAIIEEERKKNHGILAEELNRILNNGFVKETPSQLAHYQPPPRDPDRKTPLIEIKRPDRYLRDLVLTDRQVSAIKITIQEFREWDVLQANGLTPNHKLLFCGPPGCGKTVTAEAIAGDLGLPLLYVRFDSVVSSLLGETSANIRKVFDYASNGTWVLFFDEFDAIGRSRDDISEHGEIKRVVNSFLQLLDNFTGKSLIIAATNFERSLDYALWRRFDEVLRFEKPDLEQITDLMHRHLSRLGVSKKLLVQKAKELLNMSHGEVERVCLNVLKVCVMEGRNTCQEKDIEQAIQRQKLRQEILNRVSEDVHPKVDIE